MTISYLYLGIKVITLGDFIYVTTTKIANYFS